ncbi:MAG: ABC transporter permease [Thermoplasmatales archaeon]|nr:MAG: ABC transporter permease [Thermoplasmatales archaeon]
MWLRQMKRFIRSRSRVIATIVQPLFFLFLLGSGLRAAMIPGMTGDYIYFLAPGLIAMAIMLSSMYTGVSVLWDKQFGFLQEVLVAPIGRLSIIIGRTLGGATTALIQGFIILFIAIGLGVPISNISGLLLTLVFMVLIAFTAVGFGLIIASKMEDFQGFQIIMNLLIMPLFFLSTAFFPIATNPVMPSWVKTLSFLNPLFYMVDGLRGSLTGLDNTFPPIFDLLIVIVICSVMMTLGSYFFSKSEA